MAKRVSPEEHIEQFFLTSSLEQCAIQRDRIDLIIRIRGGEPSKPKRGRKPATKNAPPISRIEREIESVVPHEAR